MRARQPTHATMHPEAFQEALLNWFDGHGRKNLPWQLPPSPYRVWISEIMLQQTQVATVIPYFLRFVDRFPTVSAIAEAELDDVLSHWAGLGYYARARNLHRSAGVITERHGGSLPMSLRELCMLPGIGRSTAGAILSLGAGLPAPILDGNVKRVLSRYAGISGWPGETRISRELWAISERNTPKERVGQYNQAIMDLGATVCTRHRPNCAQCPLRSGCEAHRSKQTTAIPGPRPNRPIPVKRCLMLVLQNPAGEFLLQQRPPAGIWGGLWCLPEFDSETELTDCCWKWGVNVANIERMPERRHTFTHFHLDYRPIVGLARNTTHLGEAGHYAWFRPGSGLALPAPVRRLLEELSPRAKRPDP